LVGSVNKPKSQTTLLDPYEGPVGNNVEAFIDAHDIGKIPGIGFKMARRIRNHLESKPLDFDDGRDWTASRESVTVGDVRIFPGMGSDLLQQILGGPGVERGIGGKVWALMNGIDDTEVQQAKKLPTQISVEE